MSGGRRKPARAWGPVGRGSVIASPYLWLLFFFLVPFAIVLKISVAEVQLAIPPYTPLFAWPEGGAFELVAVGDNYRLLIEDSLYLRAYANSLVPVETYTGGHLAPIVTVMRPGPGIAIPRSCVSVAEIQPRKRRQAPACRERP